MTSHSPASSPELPRADFYVSQVVPEDTPVYTADQMNAHYLKGYEAGSAAAAQAVPEGWREALQFYADRSHFALADENAWDTVSGEPSNFWCDEAGTATVEDGTVAAMALAGTPLPDDEDTAPTQGAEGAAPQAVDEVRESDRQLMRFYSVDTLSALIDAQERHIVKLQAKLPPLRDEFPQNPRIA